MTLLILTIGIAINAGDITFNDLLILKIRIALDTVDITFNDITYN